MLCCNLVLPCRLAAGEFQLLLKMRRRIPIIRDIDAKYLSIHLYIMKTYVQAQSMETVRGVMASTVEVQLV